MGTVLLYNIRDEKKRLGILLLLHRLGLRPREVAPEEQGQPLGLLLGLAGYAPGGDGERFPDEMLVMHALSRAQFNALLDGLRRGKTPVALKAVVTEHNVAWSSAKLHRELAAEHEAMQKRQ